MRARNQAKSHIIIDCASGINEQHHKTPSLRSFAIFGGFFEMNNFSRVTGAFLLTVSLLGSSTISLAQTTTVINPSSDQTTTAQPAQTQPTQTQTQAPPPEMKPAATESKSDATKQTDSAKQSDPKTTQQVATVTPARSTKPLSTNEDPAMIGKRNI